MYSFAPQGKVRPVGHNISPNRKLSQKKTNNKINRKRLFSVLPYIGLPFYLYTEYMYGTDTTWYTLSVYLPTFPHNKCTVQIPRYSRAHCFGGGGSGA